MLPRAEFCSKKIKPFLPYPAVQFPRNWQQSWDSWLTPLSVCQEFTHKPIPAEHILLQQRCSVGLLVSTSSFNSNALWGFPGSSSVKNPPANAGDTGSYPGSGRSPGEGHGNPLQYSCLRNPMDEGASRATVGSQRVGHDWATAHTHACPALSVSLLGVVLEPLPCSKLDQQLDSHLRISLHCHPGQSFPRISS